MTMKMCLLLYPAQHVSAGCAALSRGGDTLIEVDDYEDVSATTSSATLSSASDTL